MTTPLTNEELAELARFCGCWLSLSHDSACSAIDKMTRLLEERKALKADLEEALDVLYDETVGMHVERADALLRKHGRLGEE